MSGKKDKIIKVHVTKTLLDFLKSKAQMVQMSMSGYINFVISRLMTTSRISYDETFKIHEKKEVRIRVSLTPSETELLIRYASQNNWSLIQEVRYRVVSSLSKKPKLNEHELKAIYAVRSSINVLGANVNRLIRNHEFLSDANIHICQELVILLQELKKQIKALEKGSCSRFKLQDRD